MNINVKKFIPWLLGSIVLAFLVRLAMGDGDFKVFLEAAKLMAARKDPYHVWIFLSQDNYALYFYSPLWALLLIPFSFLTNIIPNLIWLLANAYFLYRIWKLLTTYIDLEKLTGRQRNWLLFLCVLLCARYILYNFELIQMTVFLLWGSLESLSLFRNKKFLMGGMLLALIINIKILPVVLIPYLIYRREMKGALSTLVFSLLFLFLPCLYLGWSMNLHMLSEWWSVINPNNAEHLMEADLGLHSLTALIPSLLTRTNGILPYSRNIVNLDQETITHILNAARTVLVLFTLCFLKWPPFSKAKSRLGEIHELSYIFLLIPLIFPHQQKYAFLLAAPAFFYISLIIILNFKPVGRIMNNRTFRLVLGLFILSFILMTLSTDGLIGRKLNDITQHYKTITYGAILLIVILALCPPGRAADSKQQV